MKTLDRGERIRQRRSIRLEEKSFVSDMVFEGVMEHPCEDFLGSCWKWESLIIERDV